MPRLATGADASPPDVDGASAEGDPQLRLNIDVVHDGGNWDAVADAEKLIRGALAEAERDLAMGHAEVCVALSNDDQVAELNGSYRGKAKPTNVLSFPAVAMLPIEGEPRFLGDIVLALETLQREAGELGVPVQHHMQHLVVHGLLHLVGYDHQTDEEAEEMESFEVRILGRLGVADPYAGGDEAIAPAAKRD
jgi:probable rRNA maturation factor